MGLGGIRIELPPGHVLDWTFDKQVEGAVRDGRSWLIPPDAVKTKEVREGVERIMREDHKIFLDAAKFIGPRRISGTLKIEPGAMAAIGLEPNANVAADKSFFDVADPEMPVAELHEWCLAVETIETAETGECLAVLRYADPAVAFRFLRARRAADALPPALGSGHVSAKWQRLAKAK